MLDDLDDADEPSQLLAQYLVRAARDAALLVVVCCKATTGTLATLAQEPLTTQLELGGLGRAATGELVAALAGRQVSDAELGAMYEATAGNPFFVEELARQLANGPKPVMAVPRSVLDAIGQPLGRLSPGCATSLRSAAVLGTRFQVPVMAAMTDREVRGAGTP